MELGLTWLGRRCRIMLLISSRLPFHSTYDMVMGSLGRRERELDEYMRRNDPAWHTGRKFRSQVTKRAWSEI